MNAHNNITNASDLSQRENIHVLKGSVATSNDTSEHLKPARPKRYEIADLAERLLALSGLDIISLAEIFSVKRATYHRWLRGSPVTKKHYDSVLEILPFLEEVVQRLGSPEAVSRWLLTPVSAGGKKPVEYLAEKRYDLFRGFLLRQLTGREKFRPLPPSKRDFKLRNQEEADDVRERLKPHYWYDEDDFND